jgi:hypothetical protein
MEKDQRRAIAPDFIDDLGVAAAYAVHGAIVNVQPPLHVSGNGTSSKQW